MWGWQAHDWEVEDHNYEPQSVVIGFTQDSKIPDRRFEESAISFEHGIKREEGDLRGAWKVERTSACVREKNKPAYFIHLRLREVDYQSYEWKFRGQDERGEN